MYNANTSRTTKKSKGLFFFSFQNVSILTLPALPMGKTSLDMLGMVSEYQLTKQLGFTIELLPTFAGATTVQLA